jgi:uncharacterized protein (TIGR02594 family)
MSVAEAVGKNVIQQGASGPLASIIQLALRDLGYPLKGTGYFGPGTETAVRAFQRKSGLVVDGDVGPLTAAAIDKASLPGTPKPPLHSEARLPLWTQAGLSLLGVRNAPGSLNPEVIDWLNDPKAFTPDVAKSVGKNSYFPWCALGMNHFLALSGLRGTNSLWALDFADPKKWPGIQLSGPAVGAIVPMERTGGGHITTVFGRDQHGNVMCLGANQSHAVTIEPFPRARLNKGFWWPKPVAVPALIGFDKLPLVTSDGKLSTNEA